MDKLLRNNNVVKVIALIIGILLWIVVHLDADKTTGDVVVPVQGERTITAIQIEPTQYNTTQFSIEKMGLAKVNVTVHGSKAALAKWNPSNLHVELDLENATIGTNSYPLRAINIPDAFSVDPLPAVMVTLEGFQQKLIPVIINYTGTLADGYKLGPVVATPSQVQVSMPTSQLDKVESARADINLNNVTQGIKEKVTLTAYGTDQKQMKVAMDPTSVTVEIPLITPSKNLPLQLSVMGQPAPGYSVASIIQSVQNVNVIADPTILDTLQSYDGPQVDLTGMRTSEQLTLDIPLVSKGVQIDPTKVTVSLVIVPSATKTINDVPITIIGVNDGLQAKLVSPASAAISVSLTGAQSLLDKLTASDIQATVDMSSLTAGSHIVDINLSLPQYISQAANMPPVLNATVELTAKPSVSPSVTPVSGAQQLVEPTPETVS